MLDLFRQDDGCNTYLPITKLYFNLFSFWYTTHRLFLSIAALYASHVEISLAFVYDSSTVILCPEPSGHYAEAMLFIPFWVSDSFTVLVLSVGDALRNPYSLVNHNRGQHHDHASIQKKVRM